MEPADHAKTASHSTQGAKGIKYRERQEALIKKGRFGAAIQMDIDNIRKRCGDKYDEAIQEMIESLDESMKIGLKG